MSNPENAPDLARRTRRNLLKACGVATSAAAAALLLQTRVANAACFLKGTLISTADGERKVEDLAIGDLLPTHSGKLVAIKWIARNRFVKSDNAKAWVADARPIRIARSALAPNVPSADLFVTAGHAVLVDGVLVAAGSLVNGSSIAVHDARELDTLEYFNIKLDRHDVIFAQGAACETLLNVREHALNFAEYARLYGMPENTEAPCLPRLAYDGGRSALKGHLRSALSPLLDRRATIDILRDRLDDRALSLAV